MASVRSLITDSFPRCPQDPLEVWCLAVPSRKQSKVTKPKQEPVDQEPEPGPKHTISGWWVEWSGTKLPADLEDSEEAERIGDQRTSRDHPRGPTTGIRAREGVNSGLVLPMNAFLFLPTVFLRFSEIHTYQSSVMS